MGDVKRDRYWDIVKGLGIIAVVLGHAGFKYGLILNMYHLALFFFVAGYFYNDKYTCSPGNYIIKKVKDLWLPLMRYAIIMIVLHNVFIRLNIYSTVIDQYMIYPKEKYSLVNILDNILKAVLGGNYQEEMLGATWFVFPMLGSMVGYCCVRNIVWNINLREKTKEVAIYIICWMMCILGMMLTMKGVKLTWRIDISLLCMSVVSCGYLYKLYGNREKLNVIMTCVCIAILLFFNSKGLSISFAAGTIGKPIEFVLATFSGIYINLYIAKLICKVKAINSVIAYLGKNSFHIMALQFLGMKVINIIDILIHNKAFYNLAMFPYSNSSWWVLNTFAGLFVPLLLVYCMRIIVQKLHKYRAVTSVNTIK